MKYIPYTKEDFTWTQASVEELMQLMRAGFAKKSAQYEKVKSLDEHKRSFSNVIVILERANYAFSDALLRISLLSEVSPDEKVRAHASALVSEYEQKNIALEHDEEIYKALLSVEKQAEQLPAVDDKLRSDYIKKYRRMGFSLKPDVREKLQKNLKRLGELEIMFRKNINDYNGYILVNRKELEGTSLSYQEGLEKDTETGKYKVTLDYPSMIPYLQFAKDREKRRELSEKQITVCGDVNMPIITEILSLRKENAHLLGYRNHGAFVLEERMAETTENARSFIDTLMKKLKHQAFEDIATLRKRMLQDVGNDSEPLRFGDISYYIELLRREKYAFDGNTLKEYFPLEHVKEELLALYAELLSLSFRKVEGYPLWHEDVEMYAVTNKGEKQIIAYFLMDIHPRTGKYGHAAAFNIIDGRMENIGGEVMYKTPMACLVTNFPKSTHEYPALLSHDEVTTFFHEFGHIMHAILTTATYASQAGFNTAWDFVEAPSQMLENWAWEPEVLARITRHYKDHKPMPSALIEKLVRSRYHMAGYANMRQLVMALYDMILHTEGRSGEDIFTLFQELVGAFTPTELPSNQRFLARFGHFIGYDAGYYGYMWSLVYAQDMYTRFQEAGIFNPHMGAMYRSEILERGSSRKETESLHAFLGREPRQDGFLRSLGIV